MHISNGIIDAPVSTAAAVVAVAGVAACIVRARRDPSPSGPGASGGGATGGAGLDADRIAPMAGLVAAFLFAVQMLNFPVLPGVSGHLLGGALAAILVGPWLGTLCVALVLVVQALLFADGGVTALGLNVVNMGLVGTFAGFATVVLLLRVLPRTLTGLAVTAFVASVVNVVVASQAFVLEYAVGGSGAIPLTVIAGTMAGFHVLIGIGEGVITALTVVAVARVRPDLVYALRGRALRPVAPSTTQPVGGVA